MWIQIIVHPKSSQVIGETQHHAALFYIIKYPVGTGPHYLTTALLRIINLKEKCVLVSSEKLSQFSIPKLEIQQPS